jgi:hypothetical protein
MRNDDIRTRTTPPSRCSHVGLSACNARCAFMAFPLGECRLSAPNQRRCMLVESNLSRLVKSNLNQGRFDRRIVLTHRVLHAPVVA